MLTLAIYASLLLVVPVICNVDYAEQVHFTALGQGLLLADFEFTQRIDFPLNQNGRFFGTFPKPIFEIFHEYKVSSFHLSMSKSRWHSSKWGHPPWIPAPSGILMEASLMPESPYGEYCATLILIYLSVDATWNRLVNSLSGIICASLNLLTSDKIVHPSAAFSQTCHIHDGEHYIVGMLPRESVCTENLTPFLKLLPCGSRAGLSVFLNPTKIFDSEYTMLDMTASLSSVSGQSQTLQLIQNIRVVFNLPKWTGSCDWTIEQLFGRPVNDTCTSSPVAVTLQLKDNIGKPAITDDTSRQIDKQTFEYVIGQANFANIAKIGAIYGGLIPDGNSASQADVVITAHLSGVGHERNELSVHIVNKTGTEQHLAFMIVLPWFAKPFIHSMGVQMVKGHPHGSLLFLLYSF